MWDSEIEKELLFVLVILDDELRKIEVLIGLRRRLWRLDSFLVVTGSLLAFQ